MTTLRSQAAAIADRLATDKDVTEYDIVALATIIAKADPKDVPAWADANPRGFANAGYTAKQPRRSGWIAAAQIVQHFPLDRADKDPIGTDVRKAWGKATSMASMAGKDRMVELGREFGSPDAFVIVGKGDAQRAEDVTTQGNAYRWILAAYADVAASKGKGKGQTGKGKAQNSESNTITKRTPEAQLADFRAEWARLSDDQKRDFLNGVVAETAKLLAA